MLALKQVFWNVCTEGKGKRELILSKDNFLPNWTSAYANNSHVYFKSWSNYKAYESMNLGKL